MSGKCKGAVLPKNLTEQPSAASVQRSGTDGGPYNISIEGVVPARLPKEEAASKEEKSEKI